MMAGALRSASVMRSSFKYVPLVLSRSRIRKPESSRRISKCWRETLAMSEPETTRSFRGPRPTLVTPSPSVCRTAATEPECDTSQARICGMATGCSAISSYSAAAQLDGCEGGRSRLPDPRLLAIADADLPSAVQDRLPSGLDHQLVIAAIARRGHDTIAIELVEQLGAAVFRLRLQAEDAGDDVLDRTIAVSDRRQPFAAEIQILEIIRAGLGVDGGAGAVGHLRVAILQAAVLIGMRQQRTAILCAAVEHHALRIGAGRIVGKADSVLHVEACAVVPEDARVGPKKAFLAVGEAVANAIDADSHRQEAGDEVNQIHVMAADVGEGVGVLRGHPVLEVGVAVIPFLEQAGGAEPEIAKRALAIFAASHQAAIVEALVIFDADHQSTGARFTLDLDGVTVFERQRFDAADVLIVAQGRHHHLEMQLVWYGDHQNLARRECGDNFAEQIRLARAIARRVGAERLAGE